MKVTKKLVILGVALQATCVLARGGGVVGSGTDGLYLNAPADSSGHDVVVNIPGQLQQWAYFVLEGKAGSGQTDDFSIRTCDSAKPDAKCEDHDGKLNVPLKLRPGIIRWVGYSGTDTHYEMNRDFPTLAVGSTYRISLRKIRVPRVDGSYKYQVYLDLTNPEEQMDVWGLSSADAYVDNLYAEFFQPLIDAHVEVKYWDQGKIKTEKANSRNLEIVCSQILQKEVSSPDENREGEICKKLEPFQTELSEGMRVRKLDVIRALSDFGDDGTYHFIESFTNQPVCRSEDKGIRCDGFYYGKWSANVTDPTDGDFVSVLPGVYGIEFTAQDGKTSRVNGIRVE